ncbi:MAG: heat-inducible transcriptional repressor HrcA [Faecalibacterium sp.]|nr:heat-inducible transcriptional repressor HrcA [Ruminococcus sp.]MCM1392962.1 heat-inducible transcriptional repressor HrcA [Ruminococcus sp.]MCM1486499.1 heat-inducible transcriptional repressor HrcA [Faecalibacterium sp.]
MELGKRKELILAAVVEHYIKTGEPIGSKFLMSTLPISVSSATIRNEMSELAEMGLLDQPHTSAGRIPSQAGYRYYIDNLMNKYELSDEEKTSLRRELERFAGDPNKLIDKAGEMLARITNCAALATTPTDEGALVKRIEIMRVGTRLAMIVLMTSAGIIKNGVCRTDTEITDEMLENFHLIVDDCFVGKPVSDIGTVMIQTLVASLGANALAMSPMFVVLADIASQAVQAEIHLEGEQNLLHHRELSDNIFETMQFLDQSEKLERAVAASKNPISVQIGSENLYRQLENTSMIVARYNIQGHDGGAIGIIGPTRLDYAKLIPSVEYLTNLVSKFLTDTFED